MTSSGFTRYLGELPHSFIPKKPRRPLYFLHIEKTAGTSFTSILEQLCKNNDGDRCSTLHIDNISALETIRQCTTSLKLIRGHLRYEAVKPFLPANIQRLTMLREPIARTLSHLRHIQRHPEQNQFLEQFAPIRKMSLVELLNHEVIRAYLTNFQVKKLGLPHDPTNRPDHAIDAMLSLEHSTDKDLLRLALRNLSSFEFVGISEMFGDSAARLSRLLGYSKTPTPPTLNCTPEAQTKQKIEQLDFLVNTITDINQLDCALYEHGLQLQQSAKPFFSQPS